MKANFLIAAEVSGPKGALSMEIELVDAYPVEVVDFVSILIEAYASEGMTLGTVKTTAYEASGGFRVITPEWEGTVTWSPTVVVAPGITVPWTPIRRTGTTNPLDHP